MINIIPTKNIAPMYIGIIKPIAMPTSVNVIIRTIKINTGIIAYVRNSNVYLFHPLISSSEIPQ